MVMRKILAVGVLFLLGSTGDMYGAGYTPKTNQNVSNENKEMKKTDRLTVDAIDSMVKRENNIVSQVSNMNKTDQLTTSALDKIVKREDNINEKVKNLQKKISELEEVIGTLKEKLNNFKKLNKLNQK